MKRNYFFSIEGLHFTSCSSWSKFYIQFLSAIVIQTLEANMLLEMRLLHSFDAYLVTVSLCG